MIIPILLLILFILIYINYEANSKSNISGGKGKRNYIKIIELDAKKDKNLIKSYFEEKYYYNSIHIHKNNPIDIRSKDQISKGRLCYAKNAISYLDYIKTYKRMSEINRRIKRSDYDSKEYNDFVFKYPMAYSAPYVTNYNYLNIFEILNSNEKHIYSQFSLNKKNIPKTLIKNIIIFDSNGKDSLELANILKKDIEKHFKKISLKIYVIINGGYEDLKKILPSKYICEYKCPKKEKNFKKIIQEIM
tara:strand:+ start:325 stop:1065 length:741 start_codon:yes stop_codon:yes gene_type:complete